MKAHVHRGAKVPRLTLAQAREELRALGLVLAKKDGEYRVNYVGGKEATAYYCDDLGDALGTGRAMARERDAKASADANPEYDSPKVSCYNCRSRYVVRHFRDPNPVNTHRCSRCGAKGGYADFVED